MDRFIQNYNSLARKILVNEFEKGKNSNIVFSPFSNIMTMAVLSDATAGKTRQEIVKVLGACASGDTMAAELKEIQERFNKGENLLSANAVFIKPELKASINPIFEKKLQEKYDGRLFSTQELFSDVNEWVNEKTKGMIPNIINGDDTGMLFGMGNAISFESEWKQKYKEDDVVKREFTNADGSVNEVKMLISEEPFYVYDDKWTGFVKPYKCGTFSFMALLPRENRIELTEEEIAGIDFTELYEGKEHETVDVLMPEFKSSSTGNMKDILQSLGIRELFTDKADFSSFSSKQLIGGEIIHKALIEVDRKGTKAAAATFMIGAGNADGLLDFKKSVYLNRPFVFAIIDCETGLPVFIGVINYLDAAEGDEVTWEEKKKNFETAYDRIFVKLLEIDAERLHEEGTTERQLLLKARKACSRLDIQELKKIEAEVDSLQG